MDGSLSRLDGALHHQSAAEPAALEHLRLGWRPIVARGRRVLGVRIEIKATSAEASSSLPLNAVVAQLADQGSASRGLIVLAPSYGSIPAQLSALEHAQKNIVLEIGAEALTSQHLPLIDAAQRTGTRFVLRASGHPLARDWQRLFIAAVCGAASSQALEGVPMWVRDTVSRTDVDAALTRGAQATIGWPLDEPAVDPSAGLEPTRRAVLDIVRLIQGDADVMALERAFKNEPTLAMLLLSVINSPAFAPGAATAPITSLRHAILVLGYKRLVRWLVLLLGVSSSNARSMPLIYM
ncbi:MAG: HDOD domain-containing protein, partial [Burkholderiaceae bacterium]